MKTVLLLSLAIPVVMASAQSNPQNNTVITPSCPGADIPSQPVVGAPTWIISLTAGCSADTADAQFGSASATVRINTSTFPGAASTEFSYEASLLATAIYPTPNGVTISSSLGILIAGPSRPGYVQSTVPAAPLEQGSVTYTASLPPFCAGGTYPITLQNMTFTAQITGSAVGAANGSRLQAVAACDLFFYEADGVTPVQVTTISTLPTLGFVPITPCRLVDTRKNSGVFPDDGPLTYADYPISSLSQVRGCPIPYSAQAFSFNVTAIPVSTLGYLTMWPAQAAQTDVSLLNSPDGRTKSVAAILMNSAIPLGYEGADTINVYATDPTNLILDINGYYINGGSFFHPVAPCRIWDTRQPGDGPLVPNGVRSFPVGGVCGIPSSTANGMAGAPTAYALNITAVPASILGYLTVFPGGTPVPATSTLNAPTGAITANAAIVQAGLGGSISAIASDQTDIIIDVTGYYSGYDPAVTSASFYPLYPSRILDTRQTGGPFSGTLAVSVVAGGDSPIRDFGAWQPVALAINATVVPAGSLEYLTFWPNGQSMPLASTLNAIDGSITSNLALVPLGTWTSLPTGASTTVNAFASNPTNLILDVFGYFR